MHNSADAERARERLHGTVVEGRKIEVCMMLFLPLDKSTEKNIQITLNEMLFNLSQCAYI
jgi:hypothetical protein